MVDTGAHATLPGDPFRLGWEPDGTPYFVTEDGISECRTDGECSSSALPAGVRLSGLVRLGGRVYES